MAYVYLSGNWHYENDQREINNVSTDLNEHGVALFDWKQFSNMSLRDNAECALRAVDECSVYVAIMDTADHKYQGTYELMAYALGKGKPVAVFIPIEKSRGLKNGREHQWCTEFDRFLLYHPDVHVCGADMYKSFLDFVIYKYRE